MSDSQVYLLVVGGANEEMNVVLDDHKLGRSEDLFRDLSRGLDWRGVYRYKLLYLKRLC